MGLQVSDTVSVSRWWPPRAQHWHSAALGVRKRHARISSTCPRSGSQPLGLWLGPRQGQSRLGAGMNMIVTVTIMITVTGIAAWRLPQVQERCQFLGVAGKASQHDCSLIPSYDHPGRQ